MPGQLRAALQSLVLTPTAQQNLQALNNDLLRNAWWRQQNAAQVREKVLAYSKTITGLTPELLGFGAAELPSSPTPLSASALHEMLGRDAFDQASAAQLLHEATLADKRREGERLAQAVQAFAEVGASVSASSAPQRERKQQRNELKKSLQRVNKELQEHYSQVARPSQLREARKAILQAANEYLVRKES